MIETARGGTGRERGRMIGMVGEQIIAGGER